MNRVTLIVADTGSGKSSQVPQILLEEGLEPILCTQPRRFAVVSISKMVAESRGCEVGEDVGYQIGQLKVTSARSKIIFKTSGVLLEELRGEGVAALLRYKVLILDEVHERSVESDLVLTCVKQFMLRNNKIRLVLMSATADITRYRDYFKDLGKDERVEVIALPSSLVQRTLFQCRVMYLEQVLELLKKNPECLSDLESSKEGRDEAYINDEVHYLIRDLVMHIHEQEQDLKNSILVFLPTYRSLEQQWLLLRHSMMCFKVHVLHSSIDIEQATRAMQICHSYRKVILATNIAESSVTIPGLSYVIDSCRSLDIFWNENNKTHVPHLVWVSKSQADQRKGRTGRTCDGQVFRLVSQRLFDSFDKYEKPAMQKLSLRKQVLMISCAESKAMNDPKVLFQRALDPPNWKTIQDALDLLVSLDALKVPSHHRGKYEPTLYGNLLGSLPLSLEASMLVIKFGQCGFLREGALIGSLMDARPMPIIQPFGQQSLFNKYVDSYYNDANGSVGSSPHATTLMANLCAILFWQRIFKDKHRLQRLIQVAGNEICTTETHDFASITPKLEQEWSSFHHLVQSSLHAIAETYEVVMAIMHRFRPKFLCLLKGPPSYYNDYEFKHTCLLSPGQIEANLSFAVGTELADDFLTDVCIQAPYVDSGSFNTLRVGNELTGIIKEIRTQCTQQNLSYSEGQYFHDQPTTATPVCKFFAKGMCKRGNSCFFSHTDHAKSELCKFFLTLEGCRYGEECRFSHNFPASEVPEYRQRVEFEDKIASAVALVNLLPEVGEHNQKFILVFGESNFRFSLNLALHYDPCKIIITTMNSKSDSTKEESTSCMCIDNLYNLDAEILWNFDPTQFIRHTGVPWSKVQCILWTVTSFGRDEELEMQKDLIKKFFEFLAVALIAHDLNDVQVILTINNSKYAQLQVERLARDCFFFLSASIPFDNSTFTCYPTKSEEDIPPSKPISYIFELQPPTDILFGDYCSSITKNIEI
jgi:hypothetical protein